MSTKHLLSCLSFVLVALASSPGAAHAQWPRGSVLGALPPPVSTPSDSLAAFLFRMEVLMDQPVPEPPANPAATAAFIDGPFADWATAITERFRAIRESAPRARTDAERVIIRGCFALYSERFVEQIDVLFARIGMRAPDITAVLDDERRDAIRLWREVVALTEDEPAAIAWREHARYRMGVLEAQLAPAPIEVTSVTSAAVTRR